MLLTLILKRNSGRNRLGHTRDPDTYSYDKRYARNNTSDYYEHLHPRAAYRLINAHSLYIYFPSLLLIWFIHMFDITTSYAV